MYWRHSTALSQKPGAAGMRYVIEPCDSCSALAWEAIFLRSLVPFTRGDDAALHNESAARACGLIVFEHRSRDVHRRLKRGVVILYRPLHEDATPFVGEVGANNRVNDSQLCSPGGADGAAKVASGLVHQAGG